MIGRLLSSELLEGLYGDDRGLETLGRRVDQVPELVQGVCEVQVLGAGPVRLDDQVSFFSGQVPDLLGKPGPDCFWDPVGSGHVEPDFCFRRQFVDVLAARATAAAVADVNLVC